jgi:hypothetical protein
MSRAPRQQPANATPIFICGPARSGTTLLLRLLDSHPDLAVLPEETYVYQDLLLRRRLSWLVVHAAELLDRQASIGVLARRPWRSLAFADRDALRRRLRTWTQSFKADEATASAAIDAALRQRADGDSCWRPFLDVYDRLVPGRRAAARYWVEKTPSNERFIALDEREFGGTARYLHVLRDPRDVAASWLKRRTEPPAERDRTLVRICYLWSLSVHACAWGLRAYPARYHAIRYEDLVRLTRDVIRDVCRFLGLPMTPQMLEPTRLGEPVALNTSYAALDGTCAVIPSQVGRFREVLTPEDIQFVESLLNRQMQACGYALDSTVSPHLVQGPPQLPRGARRSWRSRAQAKRVWRLQRLDVAPIAFRSPAT